MRYANDQHDQIGVVDGVHNSIFSNTNSPQFIRAGQIDTTARPWIGRERFNGSDVAPLHVLGKTSQREQNQLLSGGSCGDTLSPQT